MSRAVPLAHFERVLNYRAQRGSDTPTPRQLRRMRHKFNRGKSLEFQRRVESRVLELEGQSTR